MNDKYKVAVKKYSTGEKMVEKGKTALNKAKASPFVTVPPSVRDAAKIPAVHKIAA